MNNQCPKCGLYYNAIIEGSIPVNQCKCPPDQYILKKNAPKLGKEIGDYYNGEYAESIEELVAKGVIERSPYPPRDNIK